MLLSLRSSGIRSGRGSVVVLVRYFTFPFTSCARPCLPPLCASALPYSPPRRRLFFIFYFHRLLLVPSGPGREIGTLPQTLAGHANEIGLTALALHGLAC